ncbi:hypothetical protein ACJJTC_000637 [Scirpophaga incertulas]
MYGSLWCCEKDSFCQILYMYQSEGTPVDMAQLGTLRTGLMATARHGLLEVAAELLRIGANPSIKDAEGKTAYDYALENGNIECAILLKTHTHSSSHSHSHNTNDFLLNMYCNTMSENSVDHDLMLALIRHIHLKMIDGAILVFMPGYDDIIALKELINGDEEMRAMSYHVYTMHSNMQTKNQKKVFSSLKNIRKIIIATNIAETSVTIEDVVYVVDSARVKEKYYMNVQGVSTLTCQWASRAALAQRAGRAGRTRPGLAWHFIDSRRASVFLPAASIPEVIRTPLHDLCLLGRSLVPGPASIAEFITRAPDPPAFSSVHAAIKLLKTIGALTPTEKLTELGRHLIDLTVDSKLGKMLVYACSLKCLDPVLTIVCCLSNKEPFELSSTAKGKIRGKTARRQFAGNSLSDHVVLLRAFQAWQAARAKGPEAEEAFCTRTLVSSAIMEMVLAHRAHLLAQLRRLGLVRAHPPCDIKDVNTNSGRWCVVKAALTAGSYPALARIDSTGIIWTTQESRVELHSASALRRKPQPAEWAVYEDASYRGEGIIILRCLTAVSALTVALVCGPAQLPRTALSANLSSDSDTCRLQFDDWLNFAGPVNDMLSVYQLRQRFSLLVQRRLRGTKSTEMDKATLSAVVCALEAAEKQIGLPKVRGVGRRPYPPTPHPVKPRDAYGLAAVPSPAHLNNDWCPCLPTEQEVSGRVHQRPTSLKSAVTVAHC